jgi:hypothetical protein
MTDFSEDIQNFQRYGTYVYKFDDVGNLTFNSSSADFSQVYLSFNLQNIVYNINKVESFYNPTFTEFTPIQVTSSVVNITEIQNKSNDLEAENVTLKTQLDTLTSQIDEAGAASNIEATKQVILELRKSLGQGRVDTDFSEDFPYAPILKEQR